MATKRTPPIPPKPAGSKGGTYYDLNPADRSAPPVHEDDLTAEQREQLGLPPDPAETTTADEDEVISDE